MPEIRFNHVFPALLLLSFLCAFVLPEKGTDALRPHVQGLFSWVSQPVLRLSGSISDRLAAKQQEDPRSDDAIRRENDALRIALINIEEQLRALRQLNADRDLVGPARDRTIPVAVTGADTGVRESLSLAATSADGVRVGQAVLYAGGLAGRIERVGISGAQVRLATDPDFRLLASFGRYQRRGDQLEFVRLNLPPQVVRGMGDGTMEIFNLTAKAMKESGLAAGDWAMLADNDWPMALQGYRVGKVKDIRPAKAALFVDVRIEPAANLMGLREVMVMTK